MIPICLTGTKYGYITVFSGLNVGSSFTVKLLTYLYTSYMNTTCLLNAVCYSTIIVIMHVNLASVTVYVIVSIVSMREHATTYHSPLGLQYYSHCIKNLINLPTQKKNSLTENITFFYSYKLLLHP